MTLLGHCQPAQSSMACEPVAAPEKPPMTPLLKYNMRDEKQIAHLTILVSNEALRELTQMIYLCCAKDAKQYLLQKCSAKK